ncbi:MAG: hypothetical protein MI919_00350, partial [Holophagales bacterium]|nr:hypothetical protein [Holophagales bacterium]
IVDEPTAGLDPQERSRFLNLLSEIGEHVVVLLSTHIVEDVAQLCPRFAILRRGNLLAVTTPAEAVAGLRGRLYEGAVPAAGLEDFAERHTVTQAVLVAGVNRVRILASEAGVPEGFDPAEPTLEDAYLLRMLEAESEEASEDAA